VDGRGRLPRADPGLQVPGDRRGRVEVVPQDADRAADLLHVDQGAQGDHLPPFVPDLDQVDVLDPVAVLALQLDVDLPVAAESVEAVDVERTQVHQIGRAS